MGKHGSQNQAPKQEQDAMLRTHVLYCNHKANSKEEGGQDLKFFKPVSSDIFLQQGYTS